ncbi:hypothetical protein [Desulfovibrio desulfuricans]|uniref:hypothetical protein n=1 Tax=Desulfovibrio desulfuricans TaxID=876 RepID=UPI0035B44E5D
MATEEEQVIIEETNVSDFKSILMLFLENIDSICIAISLIMPILCKSAERSQKKLEDFENKYCEVTVLGEFTEVKVPFVHNKDYNKLRKRFTSYIISNNIVPQSLFMALISNYDSFIGSLYKIILNKKPEIVNANKRNIEFKDLVKFSSISEARDFIIDKEIESLLRQNHFDQLRELETKFSIKLTESNDCLKRFIEITERRNLYAHCNGIPSDQYFNVCLKHKCNISGVQKKSRLDLTPKYFFESLFCVYELAVKLTHILWRKFIPEDMDEADSNLINIGYSLIEDEHYTLACRILDFACCLPKHSSELNKLILIVNRAQAYKWGGKKEEAQKILNEIDWSAKSNDFKLAHYVLMEDWENAIDTMRLIGVGDDQTKVSYGNWPLYKEFRKTKIFLDTYKDIFSEEFSEESVTHDIKMKVTLPVEEHH